MKKDDPVRKRVASAAAPFFRQVVQIGQRRVTEVPFVILKGPRENCESFRKIIQFLLKERDNQFPINEKFAD